MNKKILISAAILGLLAVVIGAFGAHGLKPKLSSQQFESFQTGVTYQMYHALFLLFLGSTSKLKANTKKYIFIFILLGITCFSGSIYGLSTNDLTTINFKNIWFVTPVGGTLIILAWALLLIHVLKFKEQE